MHASSVAISGEMLDRLGNVVLVASPAGRLLAVNSAAVSFYGYSREDLLAMSVVDLRGPDSREGLDAHLLEASQTGAVLETEHLRSDGTRRPVMVSAVPAEFDGEIAILGFVLDLTPGKTVEDALRRSEERLRLSLAATAQGLYDLDIVSGVATVTPEYLSMIGEDPSVGTIDLTDFARRMHPDDADRIIGVLESCVTGECDEYREEFRVRHNSGDWIWVLSIGRAVERDSDGRALRVLGSHTEISETRRAQETIADRDRWLLESQRIAGLGHYVYDIVSDHWDGSASLYDVLGVSEEYERDLAGWLGTVHPDDRGEMLRYFTEDVIGKHESFDRQYRVRRPLDGEVRWVHGRGEVEFAEDGRPLQLFGIIQDINDTKIAELELERRGAQLEELVVERGHNLEALRKALTSVIEVVTRVVEIRDPYTAGHERRVSELAAFIAEDLGMSVERIREIRMAALIHDVGKMCVPAEILSKPGKLSAIEFEIIRGHAEAGHSIIASASMAGDTAEIVYQHHERCDGSGYPRGLTDDQLLPSSKILHVADVVEAMMSHRPYRAGLGVDAALGEIEAGAGTRYDPEVAESCVRAFRESGFVFSGM